MKKIIFASESPWKRGVIEKTGLVFDTVPSNYEEDMTLDMPPEELARYLALGKAKDVQKNHPEPVIIATDVFVTHNDKVIGKAKSEEEARGVLRSYVGSDVKVVCGVAILHGEKTIQDCVVSIVKMRDDITEEEINGYIATGEPLRGGGAFQASLQGANLIENEDDHNANIGLPLFLILKHLRSLGINPLLEKKRLILCQQ